MKKLIRITSVPISMEKLLGNQLSFMNEFYEVTAVCSDAERLKIVADQFGIKHHAIEMTRTITPFKDLKSIYNMYCFFREEKPDIVHSHTPKAGLVGMIAAFFAGVPVRMHTVAGLPLVESRGIKRKLLAKVEWLTYLFCTKVYPNSQELKKLILQEKFCRESKLEVIGNGSSNGIDLSHFNPQKVSESEKMGLKKQLGIEEDDFVFIFLGRIVKDKGINELVSAFKSMIEQPLRFVETLAVNSSEEDAKIIPLQFALEGVSVSGDSAKYGNSFYNGQSITGLGIRNRLGKVLSKTPADSLSIQDVIIPTDPYSDLSGFNATFSPTQIPVEGLYPKVKLLLVGPTEQDLNPVLGITLSEIEKNPQIIPTDYVQDVRPYLAISDCLVFPSYREGFPNAVLQAGAMGLPSIVTDINGCNEIIEDHSNGLIIPVKDEKALCKAMKLMFDEKGLKEKLQHHTREKIVEKYCQKKVWKALLKEYQTALGEPLIHNKD